MNDNKELTSLKDTIDNITKTTTFENVKLLNDNESTISVTVKAKVNKPVFNNYDLSLLRDIHGNIPKVGDSIKFTLKDGVSNKVEQIITDGFGYYRPYTLPYLEFEIIEN